MAYNSPHTGPEIDAAVQMLGQVQDARDSTAEDLAEVKALSAQVDTKTTQVASKAAIVDTKTSQVLTAALEVEQARTDVAAAAPEAVTARDQAVASAQAAQASRTSANTSATEASQSQVAAGVSEQVTAENAARVAADKANVQVLAQQAESNASSAAESAQIAAELVDGYGYKHFKTYSDMLASPQIRDGVIGIVDADPNKLLNGWYAWRSASSAWERLASQPAMESKVEAELDRRTGQVIGTEDLVLDAATGQLISSLRRSTRDAAVWLHGEEEALVVDTLNRRMRVNLDLYKQADVMEGAEGYSDCREWPDYRTLPDNVSAFTLLTKSGALALQIDTVNRKVTTGFSFEANVEQRPPSLFVDIPPRLERNTNDPLYRLSGRVYQATASIERVGARFWSAWRADNTTNAEAPGNFAVLAYSDDNCQTMKEYGYVTYSPDYPDKHIVDPMLWLDPAGNLWLFFGCMGNNKGFDGVQGAWAVICQNPNAQFPVWGRPFRLSYFADPRHPVQVNGQWYLVLDGWRHDADTPPRYMEYVGPRIHRLDWQRQKLEFVSHLPPNNGTGYSGFFETEFMQRSDGSVLALCRSISAANETKFSISTDMMNTWTPWADYTVISPSSSSRMWLGRSPSGRTVFCWNNDASRRTLTLALSDDDGATYPYKVILEPNSSGQVTYPVVTFGGNGEIYVIYDNERTSGKRQIRVAKVLEQEVVAGTSVPAISIVSNPANP